MAKRFLTLDIGAANVVLAEYSVSAKGVPTLHNYGMASLAASIDTGDAQTILAPALLEIVREKGIRPGPVAVSVSGQMVFPRLASIAAVGGEERFEQMVRYEIEQNVPFPFDEMICDRQVLGENENGEQNVLIVSAKTDQIEDITSAVASAGFRPETVEACPIALTNAVTAARGEDGACVVILDIGAKTTSLVIVEGDRIYNRSIPIAGNNVTREIAQTIGCTAEEAEQLKCERGYVSLGGVEEGEDEIADRVSKVCRAVMTRLQAEISRSVNFYRSQQHGSVPVKLYLTGGSALLPQVDRFFAETLQLEVEFFNPFEFVKVGSSVDAEALGADGALLAPTVGLALHFASRARLALNLLPPTVVSERAEWARIPVVAIAGVLLIAALAVVYVSASGHSANVAAATERIEQSGKRLENSVKNIAKAAEKVETARAAAEKERTLLQSRGAACQALDAVRKSLAPGMWIEKWDQNGVTIRGWKDRLGQYAKRTAGVKAPSELVEENLRGCACVVPGSVKTRDMIEIGKNASVLQFTVEVKFK